MRRIRYRIEYVALRLVLGVSRRLSFTRAVRLATAIARLVFRCDRHHRELACRNILLSGVTADPAEARRIAAASFEHLATLAIEVIKSKDFFTQENWQEHARFVGDAAVLDRLREPGGPGIILVSGHHGNWELGAQLLSFLRPTVVIVRNMNNPHTDRLIRGMPPCPHLDWIPKHDGTPRRLVRVIKEGNILVVVADQHARQAEMWVDFFGTPASTHTTPATLHRLTGAPIVFGCCVRTAPQQYVVRVTDVRITPTGNRDQDTRAILEQLNRLLEDEIRRNPEQYLWGHRRWRPRPPASAAQAGNP